MKTVLLAALMGCVATGALAADLPTRKTPVAPPVYAPAFTWGGLYLGINGGIGYNHLSNSAFANQTGGLVGGTIGYNWQYGQVVFGGEADFDYGFMRRNNSFANGNTTYRTNWITTERLRLGYAVDRALFYVTGGYAGTSTQASFNGVSGGLNYSGSQSYWRSGGVVGGGVEYAFTNNMSAKAEYLYAPMDSRSYWGGTPFAETNKQSLSMFRVGLNYKF